MGTVSPQSNGARRFAGDTGARAAWVHEFGHPRVGELVSQDMVAVRIGPDMRMAVVGAPRYFDERTRPREPGDLAEHVCIALRLPTHGGLYVWDFEKNGRAVNVRVEGQLILNHSDLMVQAAIDGLGLANLPESQVAKPIEEGRLVRVLAAWCPPFPGYHLYFQAVASTRRPSLCVSTRCATRRMPSDEFGATRRSAIASQLHLAIVASVA